ncbi:MAG: hypothetical protein HW384_2187 [Dehalococcoidia bacterium]|nr:hypothetical protein [Dehalococcoidia bacterium]
MEIARLNFTLAPSPLTKRGKRDVGWVKRAGHAFWPALPGTCSERTHQMDYGDVVGLHNV